MKRILRCAMALSFLMAAVFLTVGTAEEIVASGTSFEATWTLYDDGTLKLTDGEMEKFSAAADTPWYAYAEQIETLTCENYSVTDYAFNGYTSLKKVEIGKEIFEIGAHAFDGCTALKSVFLPVDLYEIGASAFAGCTALEQIEIPQEVGVIALDAFSGCDALTLRVHAGSKAEKWAQDNDVSYEIMPELIASGKSGYADWKLYDNGELTVANGKMGSYASASATPWYSRCGSIKTVIVDTPEVTNYAFAGLTNVTSVCLGEDIASIGNYSFSGCTSLESFTAGDAVTKIGDHAFDGCTSLSIVSLPDGLTTLGVYAFNGCKVLSEINIPAGIGAIPNYAFSGCSVLPSVTLSEGITGIGSYAFYDCDKLSAIALPTGLTTIGDHAFSIVRSLQT